MDVNDVSSLDDSEVISKTSNKKRIYGFVISAGVFFCVFTLLIICYRVTPKQVHIVSELGSDLLLKPSDFLDGNDFSVDLSIINDHKVNTKETGIYPVSIKHFFNTYEFEIEIVDTVSPSVSPVTGTVSAAPGERIYCEDIVKEYKDEDKCVSMWIDSISDGNIDDLKSSVYFDSTGIYSVTVAVADSSNNTVRYQKNVYVDTKPVIFSQSDYYVAYNTEFSDMDYVSAFDDMDGDISSDIESDFKKDYLLKIGNYEITYKVKDSLGLEAEAKSILHVYDPLFLQNLVNVGYINSETDIICGLINESDTGYLIYGSKESAIESIKPAIVRIHYNVKTATYSSFINGSGFIIKIDDNDVILCTNQHVVKTMEYVDVSFFDGENVKGCVVSTQEAPDIAFVKVRKADIPKKTLNELKSIHINYNYYQSISNSPGFDMGLYCIYEDGSEWLTHYGKIVRKTGVLEQYFSGFDYPVTEVSVELIPGVSGSAIVDEYGNLICMAAYSWKHNGVNEYYGVSLDDILDFYEVTFNERLEYY